MPRSARTGVLFQAKHLAESSACFEHLPGVEVLHACDEHRVLQTPDVQLIIRAIAQPVARPITIAVPSQPREDQA